MKYSLPALLFLLPTVAQAAILTADNKGQLCTETYQGKPAIDRDILAYMITTEAGAGLYLDGANPQGIRDHNIELKSEGARLSEPLYAVLHDGDLTKAQDNQPFGPHVDLHSDKNALKAQQAIAAILGGELSSLTGNGSINASPTLTYRLIRQGTTKSAADWNNPLLLFSGELVILCDTHPATPQTTADAIAAPVTPAPETTAASANSPFRLRGKVSDLTVLTDNLKSATSASFTWQQDSRPPSNQLHVNGVAGIDLASPDGAIGVIPFLSYENLTNSNGKGDIDKFSPGVVLGYKIEQPDYALHTRLEASMIDDIRNDAEEGVLRAYVDPAIALGHGNGVLFGSNLPSVGALTLRPDLTLIGESAYVYQRGTSKAWADTDDYYGLGGEFSVTATIDEKMLKDFSLKGTIRNLWLLGSIEENQVHLYTGSLNYAPPEMSHAGIALSVTQGDNNDTFQKQGTIYGLNLTLKY